MSGKLQHVGTGLRQQRAVDAACAAIMEAAALEDALDLIEHSDVLQRVLSRVWSAGAVWGCEEVRALIKTEAPDLDDGAGDLERERLEVESDEHNAPGVTFEA